MAVQFILGRSGTGKTSYCLEAVVDALLEDSAGPLILLVPEQATYQAERAILADERIAGYHRLNVLSFDRLQFLLLGKNTTRPVISDLGRQMIVHRILRDNADKLKIFGSSAGWTGLARQMAGTIAELHKYAKTPDDIEQLLSELKKDELNNLSILKFTDIALVLREYLKFIEDRFIDPDIQLIRACRAVSQADFVKDAKLWVDGFAGFTTAELAVLAELLRTVAEARIALCLDAADVDLANPDTQAIDLGSLFGPTCRTYAKLLDTVKKCKLKLAEPVILEEALRFSSCPQLAHIERSVFELEPQKLPGEQNIRIVSAPNERAEVRFVAGQILRLIREKGYRYRDIAVIASDIESYQHYIRAYFGDSGVPFFIDKPKPLNQHPVVQLLCSALKAVTGGFAAGDIFAYLKTDLAAMERSDVDLLENYCLAFGISGGDWQDERDWRFAGPHNKPDSPLQEESTSRPSLFNERRINQIRRKGVGPLLELRDSLCPGDNSAGPISPEQFTRAVFVLLDKLSVSDTIAAWLEEASKAGEHTTADEHRQFFDKLVGIFDELNEVFAGISMPAEDYLAILNSAFLQLTLAFIPPTLDQVLVGSIERSRHPDLKAVFLIGATQRQFPVPVVSDSILTDQDRTAAESADFTLAPATSRSLAERQYLAYIAFTRPSQFLCVTYPAADDKGGAVHRSQFIDNLESLFEDAGPDSTLDGPGGIDNIYNLAELADLLCSRLGKDDPATQNGDNDRLAQLLDCLGSDRQLAGLASNVFDAINYDNRARLEADLVQNLFVERMRSSATALGTFAACPYQYFAKYVLELKDREEFRFEPLDLGLFYHRLLDALMKRINAEQKDFATITDEQLLKLLREEVSRFIQTDSFLSNFVRRGAHNEFIINTAAQVLEDCVLAMAQVWRAGSFKPHFSEVSFGHVKDADDTLGEYTIALPDGRVLSLSGKIDRLDIAQIEGEEVAIVFDYKRKDKSFSWSKFYYGLDMQLPIYMLAVRCATGLEAKKAIGAFYMPVEVKVGKAALDELQKNIGKFRHKAKGLFDGEFFQHLDSSNSNQFYNFFVNKKGDQYGRDNISGALRPADFEKVLKYTEDKIVQLAEEILSGKVDVQPYRIGTASPCGYCRYKSLCRFDWQINDYNFLQSLNKLQVFEKMGGA